MGGGVVGWRGGHLTEFGIGEELPREEEMSKWTSDCDDSQGQFGTKKFQNKGTAGVLLDGAIPVSAPQSHAQKCPQIF